jgi:hypothetical protein
MARVKTQLALKAAADFLRDQNDFLDLEVKKTHTRSSGKLSGNHFHDDPRGGT